jgi:hypothetical protein
MPIALCGFHGVFKLPTDDQLKIIGDYSKYFITFVMPHQGEEYKPTSNTYQKSIYKKMINNGADAVFGSHPHVVEETENYKGKMIFYSLGNFIFDQIDAKTRKHMVVDTEINFRNYAGNYKNLHCEKLTNEECLELAEELHITKPEYSISYTPIFTYADVDFITKKQNLTEKQYTDKLKSIDFTFASSTSNSR